MESCTSSLSSSYCSDDDDYFLVEKEFRFEAMHVLKYHDGKCARPHGHSYTLQVQLQANHLVTDGPKTNMLMDFQDISKTVKNMIDKYLDHHSLNETLQCDSPTAEYIAKWCYHHLEPYFPERLLYAVIIKETTNSKAVYKRRRRRTRNENGDITNGSAKVD